VITSPSRRVFVRGGLSLALASGCAARLGPASPRAAVQGSVRVLTLNLAHGRALAWTQTRARPRHWYRGNLDVVAELLEREAPTILALQEAELGSRWAGDFDHVAYLAAAAGMVVAATTPFVLEEGRKRYGTAVLVRPGVEVLSSGGAAFTTHGRWRKGYTFARVRLAPGTTTDRGGAPITVTSLHLDHASASVRRAQVDELGRHLGDGLGPHLVLGDFNATWDEPASPVRALADALGLAAPPAGGPATYPRAGRRLDWILASSPLEVRSVAVLEGDRVSDHRAVTGELVATR